MSNHFGEPELRATDVNRNRAIDLIDAAFSDGQLTAADRELRCERAMVATTLGDLEVLTRDLQVVPTPPAPTPSRRRRRVVALAAAAAVVLGAVAAYTLTGDDGSPAADLPPPVAIVDDEPVVEVKEPPEIADPPVLEEKDPEYSFTPRGVRAFIKLYDEEFGNTRGLGFGFAPNQVVIYQPTDEDGMVRRWFFREGVFLDDGPESPGAPIESVQVDLKQLDVRALFRNVSAAKQASGVDDFTYLGADVRSQNGRRIVAVAAGTPSTCYRIDADLDGTVLQRGIDCSQ